jgi:hypothetical protein
LVLADAHHLPGRAVRNGIEHGKQVCRCCRDSSLDAQYEAKMQRRFKRAAFHQLNGILYVAEVIDLELIVNAAFLAATYKFGVPFFRVGKQKFRVLVFEMERAEVERELIRLRSNVKQIHPLF